MFQQILVAIDGSPPSTRGYNVALALAKEQNATLHVLHVIEPAVVALGLDGAYYVPAEYVDSLIRGLRENGERILANAESLARKQGQSVHTMLAENLVSTVAHAILKHARKVHADVIVLGTHGRRGLARFVMGSDAEAVLRECPVPLLLVRGQESVARPAKRSPRAGRTPAGAQVARGRVARR